MSEKTQVNFRLTGQQKTRMETNAEHAGMSLTKFVLCRTLPKESAEVAELENEVRRLRRLIRDLNKASGDGLFHLG